MKETHIAVARNAFSAVQCLRRHFPECLLIVAREAAHVSETAGECDVGDGFVGARFRQYLPRVPQSHPLEEIHGGIAAELFKGVKNATGAGVRCNGQSFDRNRLVPVSFDIFLRESYLGWCDSPRASFEQAAVVMA